MSLNTEIDQKPFFEFWTQDSDGRIKMIFLSTESSSTDAECSIKNLLEKIEPVFSEKFEFEYRVKWKLIALFRMSIKIVAQNHGFFKEYFCTRTDFPIET